MEAFADVVGLRALGFGARVIDVLDREVELVLMPLRVATILAARNLTLMRTLQPSYRRGPK